MGPLGGYMGKILRVDLTEKKISEEKLDGGTLTKYTGGVGLSFIPELSGMNRKTVRSWPHQPN